VRAITLLNLHVFRLVTLYVVAGSACPGSGGVDDDDSVSDDDDSVSDDDDSVSDDDDSVSDDDASVLDCVPHTWTCAELEGAVSPAKAGANISCEDGSKTWSFTSSGVPPYESDQSTPNDIADQGWSVTMPMSATCDESPEDVIDSRGEIAFTIQGIPIFGPEDANGNDAIVYEGPTMDECWGHAAPGCVYHHHSEPSCVFGGDDEPDEHLLDDGHAPLLGWALDGFGIYAVDGGDGAGKTLDSCNGHGDAARGFHYHATEDFPYVLGCYRGAQRAEVEAEGAEDCDGGGPPPPPG
jgi:hypothetical protein